MCRVYLRLKGSKRAKDEGKRELKRDSYTKIKPFGSPKDISEQNGRREHEI